MILEEGYERGMGEGNIGAEKGQGQSPCQGAVFKYVLGKKRGKGRISMHFPGQARAASGRGSVHVIRGST